MSYNLLKYLWVFFLSFVGIQLGAQEYFGAEADRIVQGSAKVWVKDGAQIPSYVEFRPGSEIPEHDFAYWMLRQFGFSEDFGIAMINDEVDFRGDIHRRVSLTYQSTPLFDGMLVLHIRNGLIYAMNGDIPAQLNLENSMVLTESAALQLALQHVGAERYKWQMPAEETLLKQQTDNPNATYYPAGQLKLYSLNQRSSYRYSWVFNIYADQPLYRADVFVDAATGEILFEHNRIHETDVTGTAVTKYSGTRTFTTDSTGTTYRLRQVGRGNGIETYNMQKGTNYGNAVDFTDSDNYWNNFNVNLDEVAADAHWGSESTYDYFYNKYNRNSINNNGFKLLSYVHYDNNYANAFWDGQRMTYGDGNGSSMGPLTALDITAHEITHGLTSFTADLVYQNESGALNEAFSDIFGVAVEWFAKPTMANWLMGENIGTTIRSISNPKSKGLPNTYQGTYWYTGTGDNGGVHTNCGPYAYWFYILSVGGAGTNDHGQPWSVTGISIDSAAAIAYRTLTVYLTNSSQYIDARYYSILSAIDLFGPCSQQVASTTNALHAIGVGSSYVPGVISDFSVPVTEFCAAPATVNFINNSNNGLTYHWNFGDGNTSTAVNPSHTYNSLGSFTVTLSVSGGTCGADTTVKVNYISIDPQNPCVHNMPQNGTITNTNCQGFLYDSGGNQNYHNNTNGTFIIAPVGAMSVTLNFQSFSFETGYDFLYIYDGTGSTAPLIGKFDGSNLPNGGTITSSGGSITLRQETDLYLTESGFLLGWVCNYPTAAPVANFIVSDTLTCDGQITFMDVSTNGPSSWLWEFGDGNTGNAKIVNHTYQQSGKYNVRLVTANSFGADTIIKNGFVRVDIPYPAIASKAVCDSGSVVLQNPDTANGTIWFDSPVAGIPMHIGHSYTTPVLTQSTTYWVEESINKPSYSGGKPSNSGTGSYFTASVKHYLVFDAYKPVILETVNVYAGSAGNRTIELQNSSGAVLQSKTVSLVSGMNTVQLDFDIPVATGLRLVGPNAPNLFRNDGGINYPYNISNLLSITHSSASTNPTGYYYFFYQWKVSEYPCVSPRIPVEVLVSQVPPSADFSFSKVDPVVSFTDLTANAGINTWSFGDGNTSMMKNPVHTYGAIGTYQVELLVDNGCGTDGITKQVDIQSMSVQEIQTAEHLKVYPNPANGWFTIELPVSLHGKQPELLVTDMLGKAIRSDAVVSNHNQINLDATHLPPGIYLVVLRHEGA
ncbi:MAG: PKD domain-containing protein, partial [Bacteroidales bacterium]